jgi:PhzF family phenazine biosynthesis protein
MPSVPVAIVDAFTRTRGMGNRAGVVFQAKGLEERDMRAVAEGLAASETAFVLQSSSAEVKLRYFTPTVEVPFCGHGTVATLHYLVEKGLLEAPGRLWLDVPAGRLEVELEAVADAPCRIWIVTPQFPFQDSPFDEAEVIRLLGATVEMLDRSLPIKRSGPKLFVPFTRRKDLWELSPRWDEIARACRSQEMNGFFAFTREVVEAGHVAQGRYFAPANGIREDPVTGAANGPLAVYLALNGVLSLPASGGTLRATAEQGDAMGKPGRVELEVTGAPGAIERARIGGTAVTVLEGTIQV